MIVAPGTQSLSLLVQIVDDSGLGVASLVAATFPAVYIERAGETAVSVTLSDLAAENSAWSSGGVHESASGGGYYRIDAPNALAATANQCAKLVGEASGRHLICPVVQVEKPAVTLAPADVSGNLPANAVQIGGVAPGSAVIGTVGTVTNPVTVSGSVTVGGYATGQDPATLVLDVLGSAHNTANTIGAKINAAASAGDPWATNEPGSYASGTFGNLVANALTSTTSWIFAAASYTAPSVPAALGTPRQIANTPYTKTFTQNCLRTAIADQLVDASTNSPINLTGSTVAFRMISQADKSVKINNASATLTDAPNGKVAYSWTGTDLDTAGLYWGWWLVTTNGKTENFPGDGEKMTVKVVAAE